MDAIQLPQLKFRHFIRHFIENLRKITIMPILIMVRLGLWDSGFVTDIMKHYMATPAYYKLYIALLLCVLVTGCRNRVGEWIVASNSSTMRHVLKNPGHPDTKKGLYDGCFSALWTRGSTFTRYNAFFKQNVDMVTNDLYMFGWKAGYRFCFISAIGDYNRKFGTRMFSNPSNAVGRMIPGGTTDTGFSAQFYGGTGWFVKDTPNSAFGYFGNTGSEGMNGIFGQCSYFSGTC